MTKLYRESRELALEAWDETRDRDDAMDFLHQSIDGHECAIYYHKGIQFCADHNTSHGEEYLEDCGGISQDGDTFGMIACRIAFATLLVAAQEALEEIIQEQKELAA